MNTLKEASAFDPSTRTTHPIVTGGAVLAIKYKDGVMMMADTLGAYGSLLRFMDLARISGVTRSTMIGAGGEYSDFTFIKELLDELTTEDFVEDDGCTVSPKEIYSYMSRVMYNRRSQVNPLYNQLVVAGYENNAPFLGLVDLYGSAYEEDIVATGFGEHLALPLLRKGWNADMSEDEAKKLLEDCMKVLVYRNCRAINKFTIGKVTSEGVEISDPYKLETYWEFKRFVEPWRSD